MKNKCIILLIIIITISLFTGCSKKKDTIQVDKVLKGQSSSWKAELDVNGYVKFGNKENNLKVESDGNYKLILNYKGNKEDLEKVIVIWDMGQTEITGNNLEISGQVNGGLIYKINQTGSTEVKISWQEKTETIKVD